MWERELYLACSFAYAVVLFVPAAPKNELPKETGEKKQGSYQHCSEGNIKPRIVCDQNTWLPLV